MESIYGSVVTYWVCKACAKIQNTDNLADYMHFFGKKLCGLQFFV